MSTITVAQGIEDARERVTPFFEGLREDMTAHFWETFGAAAAAYRGARSEGPAADRFAGVVGELIRDAKGTASDPVLRRGAPLPAEYGAPAREVREIPPMPSRAPWATMPTDGSGRLTLPERILYSVIGGACAAVLLILGFLVSGVGSSPDAPTTDTRNAGQVVTDADLITQGGYWSWEVAESCGMRVPAECDKTLREVNAAAERYGVRVWEDGTISPLGRQY
jgi:hypothetical protein